MGDCAEAEGEVAVEDEAPRVAGPVEGCCGPMRCDSQIARGESGRYFCAEARVAAMTLLRMVFWK